VAKTQLIHWSKRVVGTWLSSHLKPEKLSRTVATGRAASAGALVPDSDARHRGQTRVPIVPSPFPPCFFHCFWNQASQIFQIGLPSQFDVSLQFSASLLLFLSILGFLVARSVTQDFFKSEFNSMSYFKIQCPISNRTSPCGRLISDWKSTQENFILAWTFKKI